MKKLIFLTAFFIFFTFQFASPARALSIANISQASSSVNLYEKLEISFEINDTVATQFQFPYDTASIAGLKTGIGISVDGLFLPPGESNWGNALVQPAFWFQPTIKSGSWVYPSGKAYWLIRFAPPLNRTGSWQYKIRARDASGTTESSVRSFSVNPARPGKHGFIKVSPNDSRYFEFSDGKPFVGVGHEGGWPSGTHKANFYRIWMDASVIISTGTHDWEPWRKFDDRRVNDEVFVEESGFNHDFSSKLSTTEAGFSRYVFEVAWGAQPITGGFEAGKRYQVRVRAKGDVENLAVKILADANNFDSELRRLGPQGSWQITPLAGGWVMLGSSFTNDLGRFTFGFEKALAVGLEGSGTVYLDEIYIGEDLGNGQIGPNVVFKGKLNYHQYFDQIASAHWDEKIERAIQDNAFLRLVILEKEDKILTRIDLNTGLFDENFSISGSRFYSQEGRKVRQLMKYFWRYLTARWGYATSLHSWELLNEGPPEDYPGPTGHTDLANTLAKFIKENDPHQHLAGTSNWGGFPSGMWNNPQFPYLDHADLHGYNNSSGSYHFGVPELDDPQLARDMALFHINYSRYAYNRGFNKPTIRGEAGIYQDGAPWNDPETPDLAQDTRGVWLHNYIWSGVDPWGMYELYWYPDNIRSKPGPDGNSSNGLYEIYTPFLEFMDNIPLTNGRYQDAQPQLSSSSVRAWGQKDDKGGGTAAHGHLWIQNKNHLWKNVVQGGGGGNLSGTVTLSGFGPNTAYPVEWWQFDSSVNLTKRMGSVTSNSQGQIVLSLPTEAVDAGVKIGDYGVVPSPPPPPPPTPTSVFKEGDVNQDSRIDAVDALVVLTAWLSGGTTQYQSREDINDDGKVNGVDFGGVVKNWGL